MKAKHGYLYLPVDTDNLRRELYVTAVGSADHPNGRNYPSPGHPRGYAFDWPNGRVLGDFALILISRGAGLMESRAGKQICQAGDVLLVPPGVWHRYRPNRETGWHEHWVCANGEYLHRLRAKQRFMAEPQVCRGAANATLLSAHRQLWNGLQRLNTTNDLALAAEVLQIFGLALRTHDILASPGDQPDRSGDPTIDAAREYIWFNSHRQLSVGLLAREIGVSRRTLERRYARVLGITAAQEITARRVARARQLLGETRMSVKEISYTVGFGNSRSLIRSFSRLAGVTPLRFRERLAKTGLVISRGYQR